MNRGNWFAKLLTSTCRQSDAASSGVVGAAGEKKTSDLGLMTELLPSVIERSEKIPVFERPSVMAANRVELLPKNEPFGQGRDALGPVAACQTIPLPMSAM